MKIFGAVFAVIVFTLGVSFALMYISAYNGGNEFENMINTKYRDNKNVLSQYSLRIVEMVKVSDKYKDALKETIKAAIEGRYGENGSQATWQWIQENNPTIDPSLYAKVQTEIASGRKEFEVAQRQLLDKCNVYKTELGYLMGGFMLKMAGYPKTDADGTTLDKKCTPVVSGHANEAFSSGVEESVI